MFRFISHKFRFISPHPERNARRRTDKVGDVMKPQLGLDRSTSNQQPTGVHYVCRYFEPFFRLTSRSHLFPGGTTKNQHGPYSRSNFFSLATQRCPALS